MLRKFILFFMMLWLPLQAGAALASTLLMDTPAHQPPASSVAGRAHALAGHDQDARHAHEMTMTDRHAANPDSDDAHASAGCEHCGVCQFVHGGLMLGSHAGLPCLNPASIHRGAADERFSAHIPEPLQRPPLSAA